VEEERRSSKEKILTEIEVGQRRKGVVKNIADFGVFVDLGGLDGLLHISDLSWGRISHPSEVVDIDEEIECVVIGVDKEHEKISLGLKQKTASPWEDVDTRYPIGARVRGKVVNVMNYGVFVRLEDGIEGLVHISEMSWTRRLAHPGEMVNLGDEIDETNPWAVASQKYPTGTIVNTTVRSVTNFGAFVEIEPGIDGMVHISDLSWTRKYSHPSEALQKGQEVKCVVLDVNEEKRRVSLGIKQMTEDPWLRAIPDKYIPGHIIKGKVAKLTNFGAFVELEPDLEGLLHISELADHKIDKPQDIVDVGQELEVKILKVDGDSRKIGLSLRRVQWAAEEQAAAEEPPRRHRPTAVQSVLSDSDVERLSRPKDEPEKVEASVEAGEAKAEAVESKDVEEGKAQEAAEADGKSTEVGETEAEAEAVESKGAEEGEAQEPADVEDKSAEAGETGAEAVESKDVAEGEVQEPGEAEDKSAEAGETEAEAIESKDAEEGQTQEAAEADDKSTDAGETEPEAIEPEGAEAGEGKEDAEASDEATVVEEAKGPQNVDEEPAAKEEEAQAEEARDTSETASRDEPEKPEDEK